MSDERIDRLANRMVENWRTGGSTEELLDTDEELRSLAEEDHDAMTAVLERWTELLRDQADVAEGRAREAERQAEAAEKRLRAVRGGAGGNDPRWS